MRTDKKIKTEALQPNNKTARRAHDSREYCTAGNSITQIPSEINELERTAEPRNSGEYITAFHPRPQRARQPPARFGYNTPRNLTPGVCNVRQNPTVEMMPLYGFIPAFSPLFLLFTIFTTVRLPNKLTTIRTLKCTKNLNKINPSKHYTVVVKDPCKMEGWITLLVWKNFEVMKLWNYCMEKL